MHHLHGRFRIVIIFAVPIVFYLFLATAISWRPRVVKVPGGAVSAVAFSPDGQWLATGSTNGTVKLWDVKSYSKVRTLSGNRNTITSVAFAPDSQTLASVDWESILQLHEMATGRLRWARDYRDELWGAGELQFTADGKTLASDRSWGYLKLWDSATGARKFTAELYELGKSYSMVLWDGRSIKEWSSPEFLKFLTVRDTVEDEEQAWPDQVSPDGRLLAWKHRKEVQLWDFHKQKLLRVLSGHQSYITTLAFSPDSTILASGDKSGIVNLWDMRTGRQERTLITKQNKIYAVAISPDGNTLAVGGKTGTVSLWRIR